jgi:hypothetical protein
VKTFDDSKIPKVGGEVTLTPDVTTDPEIAVTVKRSRGLAEVLEVAGETGERGCRVPARRLVVVDPEDRPTRPVGSDPEAWKGNGGA